MSVIQYIKITIIDIAAAETIIILSVEVFVIRQTQTGTDLHRLYFCYPLFQ